MIDTSEQEHVAGVAFKPGGTVPFIRVPADEISDADIPLAELWSRRAAAALRERLLESRDADAALDVLEATLRAHFSPPGLHPAVAFALTAFARAAGTATIAGVTSAIGMSPKRFIERFKTEVGLTPKRFCRIRRFQHAVTRVHRRACGGLAGRRPWCRLLRPGPLHSRLPFVRGTDADGLPGRPHAISEPRQIPTIRLTPPFAKIGTWQRSLRRITP